MAGPYTHVVFANECLINNLLGGVKVDDQSDYLLGSTFPDIIRVSLRDHPISREVTHLTFFDFYSRLVKGISAASSEQKSFLLGYVVHLVTDKIWNKLVYCKLEEETENVEYQNPRLTFLVDRALWLKTPVSTRKSLSTRIAHGSDRGVMEKRLANGVNSGVLKGKNSTILDWRNRLSIAIADGPENLGLLIKNKQPILELSYRSGLLQTVYQFASIFQKSLAEQIAPAVKYFQIISKIADNNKLHASTEIMESIRHYDEAKIEFSENAVRCVRQMIEAFETL